MRGTHLQPKFASRTHREIGIARRTCNSDIASSADHDVSIRSCWSATDTTIRLATVDHPISSGEIHSIEYRLIGPGSTRIRCIAIRPTYRSSMRGESRCLDRYRRCAREWCGCTIVSVPPSCYKICDTASQHRWQSIIGICPVGARSRSGGPCANIAGTRPPTYGCLRNERREPTE